MISIATDGQLLLAAILHAPEDDAPRLAYADWLDENGQHERAEFVRVQCELAAIDKRRADLLDDETDWSRCDSESGVSAGWCPNCGDCTCPEPEDRKDDPGCPLHSPQSYHCILSYLDRKTDALRRRERGLWEGKQDFDTTSVIKGYSLSFTRSVRQQIKRDLPNGLAITLDGPIGLGSYAVVRRGFVASISCTLAGFMGGPCEMCERYPQLIRPRGKGIHGCPDCKGEGRTAGIAAELFARQPVMGVTLTDREPFADLHLSAGWQRGSTNARVWPGAGTFPERQRYAIPDEIFALLLPKEDSSDHCKRFPSRDAALASLSAACVRHGRQLAGLPAL